MSISSEMSFNNVKEKAELMLKVELLKEQLYILYDRIEGYTQFMDNEEIKMSNKYFNKLLEEEGII